MIIRPDGAARQQAREQERDTWEAHLDTVLPFWGVRAPSRAVAGALAGHVSVEMAADGERKA